ncbi:MAG: molybdenum enzyme, large subunit,related to phenylacetyl-CoA: acceptor oxidoreductase [Candidatus Rokubacteria bacterium GWC2_70_24]|nr:MAG: molybdenum enzyme, large subunit,related to phenylacetyl-CoA: acceptor oxidoreductase [Candidatus Rokubacteria bacterium GWC2_70_24]
MGAPKTTGETATKGQAAPEDRWIPSACTICYGGCSILAHRVNGTIVKIEGNPASPIGRGHICAKGLSGIMLLYDPNRVNTPLRRTNPKKGIGVDPGWTPISWEEALEEITVRMEKIRAEDPRQLMIQVTTTLAPSSLLFFTFGWAFGTPNMWVAGGGIHCGNGAHAVGGIMHGSWSLVPDFEHCNYALYFGASKGHGAGHASTPNMELAADARVRGMRMVVVDPMCNFAAAKASEWVPIRVGTDEALAMAMVNVLLNELGIYDAEYLRTKTNGAYLVRPDGHHAREAASGKPLVWDVAAGSAKPYDDTSAGEAALLGEYQVDGEICRPAFALLKEHVRQFTPEWQEALTTVPAAQARRLAREFGEAARVGSTIVLDGVRLPYRPAAAIYFRGAQGHKNSSHICFAVDLLNQIVGAADVVGGALGFNPVCHGHPDTGRPHYVPRAEKDGLMTPGTWMLPHLPYPPAEPRHPDSMGFIELFPLSHVSPLMASADQEQWWERFNLPYRPKMMINYGANSLMSVGNKETVAETLSRYEFIVSFDLFLNEFSDFADIILPDGSYLEVLDPRPNFPFIFNHPAGRGQWGWPIRQPVAPLTHERRSAREVLLGLAYRMGLGPEMNMALNVFYGLDGPQMLDPKKTYTFEEIADRELQHKFGPEHGLPWFKEHGVITWPKKVEEVYWRPFVDVRVPIYWEFMLDVGEKIRKLAESRGMTFDPAYYHPMPEWIACPSHEVEDPAYDLFAFYYRDVLHTNSFTMENPWLDEASRMDPYSYTIALNTRTARTRGIKDGDTVWLESATGRRVSGKVRLTEGIHPEGVGIAACAGHWTRHQPIAQGKGVFFNDLLEVDFEHTSPVNLNLDLCAKVRVVT